MCRSFKFITYLLLLTRARAFVSPPRLPTSFTSQRLKTISRKAGALTDFVPAAVTLFNNMKNPASIIAGAIVPIGFVSPLKYEADDDDGPFAIFLRRVYPIAAVLSISSELVSVMWATVAVNQLTETKVEMASSVWHLIQRDFAIPWVATNSHFVLGMMGFMWVICSRAYFMGNKSKSIGAAASGFTFSSLLLITSIVNRGVEAGGGNGMRFGSSILALFQTYFRLLATYPLKCFGPLEVSSVAVSVVSLISAFRIIKRDVFQKKNLAL